MLWNDESSAWRGFVVRNPLATALTISLIIHATLFGGWRVGKKLGWWDHQATWLLKLTKKTRPVLMARAAKSTPPVEREIPLTFVEVDPATAATEAPKDAKFYGAHSSKAANPDPILDSAIPKVDGQQNKMTKLDDVRKPQPLQPSPPPEEIKPPQEQKAPPPGDLAKVRPDDLRKQTDNAAEIGHVRPRTLAAAREQKQALAGEKMKQDGGAAHHGKVSLNVKATPFGSYDAAFIAAVQQRWYELLEDGQFAQRSGKVVLEFRLHYDGRISEVKMSDNEVGDLLGLLCQKAVQDPAPFPRWPDDMRRLMGLARDVTITFFYN